MSDIEGLYRTLEGTPLGEELLLEPGWIVRGGASAASAATGAVPPPPVLASPLAWGSGFEDAMGDFADGLWRPGAVAGVFAVAVGVPLVLWGVALGLGVAKLF